jgi:hypothetical protein
MKRGREGEEGERRGKDAGGGSNQLRSRQNDE